MIDEFYLGSKNRHWFRPNITYNPGNSLFEFASDEAHGDYIRNRTKGIRWTSDGREILIFEEGNRIFGLPTPDGKRVVVIYPSDHRTYPAPENAVVYNADGSVHLRLKMPRLVSSVAQEHERFVRKQGGIFNCYFDGVLWTKNSEGKGVIAVKICFHWEWIEERQLEHETGEFGECLAVYRV